jgi:hypothetical protein
MPNWIDEQVQKQRFADMVRAAQRDLLANELAAAPSQHIRFYNPILVRLGRWLEAWGYRLQARYGPAPEVAIATDSRGTSSRC